MRLILASASPRRRDLLAAAGFTFETHAVDVDERPRPGESPADYVRRVAREKSLKALDAVRSRSRESHDLVVIGADTAVILDNEILGKPADDAESRTMLARLSGRAHQVLTGVSVRSPESEVSEVDATTVCFSRLSEADIAWYLGTGEGRDKAGAYGIQGLASRFIPRIEGSYSNVVGLPIATVVGLISELRHARSAVASGGNAGLS